MATHIFRTARWSYDLDGNATGYTDVNITPGGFSTAYINDGGPDLVASFSSGESGYRDYEITYENSNPLYPKFRYNLLGSGYIIGIYEPTFPSGWSDYDAAVAGYAYWGATVGAYQISNGSQPPVLGLPSEVAVSFDGTYVPGRYKVIGDVNHTFEIRKLEITNLRVERPIVDVQSRNPLVKILGDITVYPNQQSGFTGWKPSNDIHYRIKIKSPLLPSGEHQIDGVIPSAQISNPNANGVVAHLEQTWDGRTAGVPLYCSASFDIEARAVTNVEVGNTLATSNLSRVILTSCRGKLFNKETSLHEEIPLYADEGAHINPTLTYASFESAEAPASMGYGWSSTESAKVFELEDESLAYCDESGGWLRWLKNGTSYEPLMVDNKVSIEKTGSTSARYVVRWRDRTRREFDEFGNLRKQIDRHGRTTTYDKLSGYHKVEDDKGRVVYQHFTTEPNQPSVINDSSNSNAGRRYLLDYWGSSDPAPGRLKSITDPAGNQTLFVYNAAGRIVERREVRSTEGNRSTFYQYGSGAVARLVSVRIATNKAGVAKNHIITSYGYEVPVPGKPGYTTTRIVTQDLENVSSLTDNVVYLAYDSYSRLTAEFELVRIDPGDVRIYRETYHEYNDPNDPFLRTKTIDPNGAITQWFYTPRGNLKRVLDAQNNETVYSYVEEDVNHPAYLTFPDLVTEIRRPAPDLDGAPTTFYEKTKFTYDEVTGDLLDVEDAKHKHMAFRYDSGGRVDRTINRRGFKTYLEYNVKGQLWKTRTQKSLAPSPSTEEFSEENAADFRTTEMLYDNYGNVTEVLVENKSQLEVTYDGINRPLTITDGNQVPRSLTYVEQVLKQVTLPDSGAGVDGSEDPLYHTNRVGKTQHDPLGRVTSVLREDSTHSAQSRVKFAYDGFSRVRSLIRQKNGVDKAHSSEYDRQGRTIKSIDANGKESSAAYEPFCVGHATTSARGVRTKSSFDTLCRLTQVVVGSPDPDPLKPLDIVKVRETRSFEHDDLGRLTKTSQTAPTPSVFGQATFGSSPYGSGTSSTEERSFEYNELDQVETITFEDGKEMFFEYDEEGNLTKVTENASGASKVTLFSYYGDNRLYEVTYVGRSGGDQTFRYLYDNQGRPLELWYPSSTGIKAYFSGPGGPVAEPGWDGNGQLKHLRYMKGSTTVRRFEYGYDAAGNRISQLDVSPTKATRWVYGYDWLDRLESVKKAEAATVGALGALQLVAMYTYDAADNRYLFEVPSLSETYRYSYDDADSITEIEKKVGSGSYSTIETFTSDDDGNLLTRVSGGVTTTYTWTDFNRLKAISTSDNSKKQSHTFGVSGFRRKKKDKNGVETTEYAAGLSTKVSKVTSGETITYLKGGGGIMGFERSSDGAMFWFLTDALSTVRDVVNSSGAVAASYEFDEYGQRIATSESGVSSQKTFVGGLSVQDEVPDTGLMMMGHRFYAPDLGRFLNRDPIGFRGGANLFEYASSNPIGLADPSGKEPSSLRQAFRRNHNDRFPEGTSPDQKRTEALVGAILTKLFSPSDAKMQGFYAIILVTSQLNDVEYGISAGVEGHAGVEGVVQLDEFLYGVVGESVLFHEFLHKAHSAGICKTPGHRRGRMPGEGFEAYNRRLKGIHAWVYLQQAYFSRNDFSLSWGDGESLKKVLQDLIVFDQKNNPTGALTNDPKYLDRLVPLIPQLKD